MTCPSCQATLAKTDWRVHDTIGVCPSCARSVVKDKRTVRLATAADIRALSGDQLTQLRQARPTTWRNSVRARHKAILGRRG